MGSLSCLKLDDRRDDAIRINLGGLTAECLMDVRDLHLFLAIA